MSPRDPPEESSDVVTQSAIAGMFESALGAEKARDLVADYFARAGITTTTCTRQQAVEILDRMAKSEGIVAVVARFAKARMLLRRSG